MGEAKRRGTFQQRQAEGIAKRLELIEVAKEVIAAKEREQEEAWKQMTLDEKKALIEFEALQMIAFNGAFANVSPERIKELAQEPV